MSQVKFLGNRHYADLSELQMELVAADLTILMKHSGVSRAELARKLGWKKSRITHVLSGDTNLTIKTINQVANALGYGFDIIFHNHQYPKPKQPWQVDKEVRRMPQAKYIMELQDGDQVFESLMSGDNEPLCYVRIDHINKQEQISMLKHTSISMSSQMLNEIQTKILVPIGKESTHEQRA